ncbi:DUF4097 family beta strand repeat-containing protein [Fodinicola acaciae]|uniref:DUF4097 family beta strand repeat-containing protein n=1 Tax=Fodinicola acaciae TaxID=2681555 RepID=UPI0013D782AD|nr:DUF4097 family beta strand repeat-containing protein [Fodinicola acaciae]
MTPTEAPPKAPYRGPIVAGGLILLLVASSIMSCSLISRALPGTIAFRMFKQVNAARTLQVDTQDADITIQPGVDGQISVGADGYYTTREPTFAATAGDGTTHVSGGCLRGERRCSLELTISVPRSTELRLNTQTGSLRVDDIAGAIDAHSTDGRVEVNAPVGAVRVRTENGEIRVGGAQSQRLDASSVNGQLRLDFVVAPAAVTATSVNGAIGIQVPPGVAYRVDAESLNTPAKVKVDQNPSSPYVISATSNNGSVEVFS